MIWTFFFFLIRCCFWDFTGNFKEVREVTGKCYGCNWWEHTPGLKTLLCSAHRSSIDLAHRPRGRSSGVQEFPVKAEQCKRRASFKHRRLGETASLPWCLIFIYLFYVCTSLGDESWSGIRFRIWFTGTWRAKELKTFLDQLWQRRYCTRVIISRDVSSLHWCHTRGRKRNAIQNQSEARSHDVTTSTFAGLFTSYDKTHIHVHDITVSPH